MVRRTQKEEERSWLERFRSICPDVPPGQPDESEQPAFVFPHSPSVGIEIVEAFRPQEQDPIPRQSQEELWWRITESAQAIFEARGGPPLTVLAHTNPRKLISKADVTAAAEALAQIVHQHTPAKGGSVRLQTTGSNPLPLPKPFHCLNVFWFAVSTRGHWSVPDSAFQAYLEPPLILAIVRHKDKLVPTYRAKAHSLWLLIVADGTTMSRTVDLSEAALSHSYPTLFDRIYFFDRFGKRYWRLRTDNQLVAG